MQKKSNLTQVLLVFLIMIVVTWLLIGDIYKDQLLASSATRAVQIMEAKAFRVVDDNGSERAYLGLDKDDNVALTLRNEINRSIAVTVKKDGKSTINLVSADGKAEAILGSGPRGVGDLMLFITHHDYGNINLTATGMGGLAIQIIERSGNKRFDLRMLPNKDMSFEMFDKEGKPIPLYNLRVPKS